MHGSQQRPYLLARIDAPVIYRMGCDDWYHSYEVEICRFGSKTAAHTAVVMGDSIGLQWFPAYAKVFIRPDWQLLVITKSSCPMVDAPIFYERIGRQYTECKTWRDAALQRVAAMKPEIVILGSTFTYDLKPAQWKDGTKRVLERLSKSTDRVFVMRSTPTLGFDGPSCLAPRSKLFRLLESDSRCRSPAHSERSDNVYRWLRGAAKSFANVKVLDLGSAVCPNEICRVQLDGTIVFRDSRHLTATFARSLAHTVATALHLDMPDKAAEDTPSAATDSGSLSRRP